MGGSKGDRKSYKATSAAKAAEALAAKGVGAGFGGFSGAQAVAGFGFGAPAAASHAVSDPGESAAQLDSELAQCLRHLSKRDTTTKLKALQGLDELIRQKTSAELTVMLQPWAYHFKRLLMDNAKAVRISATAVMAALAAAIGKALAPQLKSLFGPWLMASFDPYPDAAAAAKRSMAEVFPGRKQLDALVFCRTDVLTHIASCMTATPQSLGDPLKETPEELQERHERVLSASLSAAGAVLTTMQQGAGQQQQQQVDVQKDPNQGMSSTVAAAEAVPAGVLQEVYEQVAEIMSAPAFFKHKLGSKSALVQRAAYGFIQSVCRAAPHLLSPWLSAAAPAVFNSLQDKVASNHAAMWEMLLAFVSSQKPACWDAVNVQKAVIPRLLSLLRHGCYGSSVTSLPAVLPFLTQLPQSALAMQPVLLLDQVLESIWIGQGQQAIGAHADGSASAAVTAAYQECLSWGLKRAVNFAAASETLADAHGSALSVDAGSSSSCAVEAYCRQLLQTGHFSSLLQQAFGGTHPNAHLAAGIVQAVLLQQISAYGSKDASSAVAVDSTTAASSMPVQLQVLCAAVSDQVRAALLRTCQQQQQQHTHESEVEKVEAAADAQAAAGVDVVCMRVQQLLDVCVSSTGDYSPAAAEHLAATCCQFLIPIVQAGQHLPAPASSLLARLIREYPLAAKASPSASTSTAQALQASSGSFPAGNHTGVSSIAALVKLCVSSCASGGAVSAAQLELLLSCLIGDSSTSTAWAVLLDAVNSVGQTAAAWHFLNALLQQATSSSQLCLSAATAAAGEGDTASEDALAWNHPLLDAYILQLLQHLQMHHPLSSAGVSIQQQAAGEGSVALGCVDAISQTGQVTPTKSTVAAAALLATCLGANQQQNVLLSQQTVHECLHMMSASLVPLQQECSRPDDAVVPIITALCKTLDSTNHMHHSVTGSAPDSGGSSRGLWQQHGAQLVQLLMMIWQLAWAPPHDSLHDMMTALDDGSSTTSSTDAYSSSSSSLSDSSSLSEDASTLAAACGDEEEGEGATKQLSLQSSREVAPAAEHAWQAAHGAAGQAWDSTTLSTVFAALPEAASKLLTEQLQQMLVLQVRSAVTDLHGAVSGADSPAFDAAVCAGTRLALRIAVALQALHEHVDAQQQLVQAVLSATNEWPRQSANSCSGRVQEWPAAHVMMLQLSAVLVLQVDPDVVMPLHQTGTGLQSDEAASTAHSGSSSSVCSSRHTAFNAQRSRVWLRLQLSSACSALEQPASWNTGLHGDLSSSSGVMVPAAGFTMAIKKAASEAQQHLIKAAGIGGIGATSSAARSQLLQVLAELLDSACASNPPTDKHSNHLHGSSSDTTALLHLLSRIVAAAAASSSPDAKARLLSVLQQFTCQHVKRAVESLIGSSCRSTDPKSQHIIPESAAVQQTSVLVGVLQWCAGAIRFSDGQDEALLAAQLPNLSVYIMQEAIRSSADAAPDAVLPSTPGHNVWPAVKLAIACFPTRAPHTQEQRQQQQHVPASTPSERQALAALLREVCSSHNSKESSSSSSAANTSEASAAAQAQLKCQLQLCCVSYCWAEMMAAEWHIVLRDSQQQLMSARRGLEKAASNLAGAVCTAAQQLTGSRDDKSSSDEVMSASMAIQLLRRLQQRGMLQKQPAVAQVLKEAVAAAAQQLSELSLLHVALQVLAAVLLLKEQVQAAGRAPQLDLALAAAFRELLSLLLAIGAAVAVAGCCGDDDGSSVMLSQCEGQRALWELLQHCLHGCSAAAGDAVGKSLTAADDKMEMLGVDAVAACLALLQQGMFHSHCHHHHHQQQQAKPRTVPEQDGCKPLQELAWELLLHPDSLRSITHAATVAESNSCCDSSDQPEYNMCEDAVAYLVKVGIRPEMAAGLTNSKPWQQQLLLWALLLAHVTALPQRSAGQRYLCQALREVPELVPQVLDRIVSIMGLGGSSKGSQAEAGGADGDNPVAGPAAPSRLSAAAQAALSSSLQTAGTSGGTAHAVLSGRLAASSSAWSMATALCSVGLPHSHSSWRLVAAAVYRAVLCTLPASARTWFNDLRDRTRSAAVEQYTTRHESPALLAAEFAGIKRDAAGSSGEVGGSCSFRVVANAANREITAVLEIEDGATLELVVKLPAAAPLKAPEVDCKNKVGIKENRLRKWLLSIAVFLRNQNQGVLDGIAMWKANLEQEFAGVEACLICFSVISAANGQLPRITCKQCNVKFHPACLYKWFKSSGKSTCPHCSALF